MDRAVILVYILVEAGADLINRTIVPVIDRCHPMVFKRAEPALDLLSEYSDKRSYTTLFIIRIFSESH